MTLQETCTFQNYPKIPFLLSIFVQVAGQVPLMDVKNYTMVQTLLCHRIAKVGFEVPQS